LKRIEIVKWGAATSLVQQPNNVGKFKIEFMRSRCIISHLNFYYLETMHRTLHKFIPSSKYKFDSNGPGSHPTEGCTGWHDLDCEQQDLFLSA
jgi:hypothetical protein